MGEGSLVFRWWLDRDPGSGVDGVGREGEKRRTRNDILLCAQQVGDADLLHMGILLLEIVRESERHNGQAGVIVLARLSVFALIVLSLLIRRLALGPVDVAHAAVPAGGFEGFAQQPRVGEGVLHDRPIAFEAQVDQVVVLGDDLGTWAGKVEREGFFGPAQVV